MLGKPVQKNIGLVILIICMLFLNTNAFSGNMNLLGGSAAAPTALDPTTGNAAFVSNNAKNDTTGDVQTRISDKEDSSTAQKSQRIIVKYKSAAKTEKANNVRKNVKSKLKINKLDVKRNIPDAKIEVIEFDASETSVDSIANEFKKSSDVEYVQPDYLLSIDSLPRDERLSEQWGLMNDGQMINGQPGVSGVDVHVAPAWDLISSGESVIVGVLDTGVDISHKDIRDNIFVNSHEIPGDGIDNDGNGYVDDVSGFDFVNDDQSVCDSPAADKHGTHIAGIIAGSANADGIVGVAPNNARIVPLKFADGTAGYTSDAIEAIEYAKSIGVQVINCSFGSPYYNQALYDSMRDAGILFIAAAGNSGANVDNNPTYPASFTLPNVMSVGAIDNNGNISSFSNYGSGVHVFAPGKDILSTIPGNDYDYMSGTSAAAAFVTGAAVLLLQNNGQLSGESIKTQLIETAVSMIDMDSRSYRLINISKSLGLADGEGTPNPIGSPAPTEGPEKPVPGFDIVSMDVRLSEYQEKLVALEKQAVSKNLLDVEKSIREKIDELKSTETQLRQLPAGLTDDIQDKQSIAAANAEITAFYAGKAADFYALERAYQYAISEFTYLIQGDSVLNMMSSGISVNSAINIELSEGVSQVFEFIPPSGSQYIFKTSPYAGAGSANDTVLEIFSDAALTNRVAYDDDSAGNLFSKISINLNKGTKYYVKVSPYRSDGSVYAQFSVIYDASSFADINLDVPTDVILGVGEFTVYKFTPSETAIYELYTGPYGGSGPDSDTYLEVFSDAALTNRVAYNDDTANNMFSEITVNLDSGTAYYIKLSDKNSTNTVRARLTVTSNNLGGIQVINLNSPVNISLGTGRCKVFAFTPSGDGLFNLFTGFYADLGIANDTYLELYSDAGLTDRMAYDDDSAGNLFSKIQANLEAGTTYYVKVSPYGNQGYVHAKLSITKEIEIVPLTLDIPMDLQVEENAYAIVAFTPEASGIYLLLTSPNGKSNPHNSNVGLELYTDKQLSNMIAYGEDEDEDEDVFPFIEQFLGKGITYYILFKGNAGSAACATIEVNRVADVEPPTVPADLIISYTTAAGIGLSWRAASDNIEVAGYDIYQDGVYLASTSSTHYKVENLEPETEYHFSVKAKDNSDNLSDWSIEAVGITHSLSEITASITLNSNAKRISIDGNGSRTPNSSLTLLVKGPNENIVYIDQTTSDGSGRFAFEFLNKSSVAGNYKIMISGNGVSDGFVDYIYLDAAMTDTSAPSVPGNLYTSSMTDTTVNLIWDAPTDNVGVVGYDIYKDGEHLATVDNTSYQVTGLLSGVTYRFYITAKDAAGNISRPSSELTVKTMDTVAPDAPVLSVSQSGSEAGTEIMLSWTEPTDNVGVFSYDVYKDGMYFTTTETTSLKISGLTTNEEYRFTVTAKDFADNISVFSNEVIAVPVKISAATAVAVYNKYSQEVALTGSVSNGQGHEVTILICDPNGASKYLTQVTSGIAGEFSVIFLLKPTVMGNYTVKINGDGIFETFVTSFAVTELSAEDTFPPSAPTNLTVTEITGTSITFAWEASADNVGVVSYAIYLDDTYLAETSATTYQVGNLLSTQVYKFKVYAKDAAGNVSEASNEITVKTLDDIVPTAPTNLNANNLTGTTVGLNWTASADNVGVAGYVIYKDGVLVATVTGTFYQVTGLSSAATYAFIVKAKDEAGNVSDPSNEITVTTFDVILPTAPTNLLSSNITGTTVDLSWTASTDNVGVTGYDIYKDGIYLATVTETVFQVTGLSSAVTYKFTVKAKDAADNISGDSNEIVVKTLDIEPPTAPTNLHYNYISPTVLDLFWTASTDNDQVAGYDIYKDGVLIATTAETTYQISNLLPKSTYKFIVKAKDSTGNISNASNELVISLSKAKALTVNIGNANDVITINGHTSLGEGSRITIKVTYSNGLIAYLNQTKSGANGAYSFTFSMESDLPSEIFTVTVTCVGIDEPVVRDFEINATGTLPDEPISVNVAVRGRKMTVNGYATGAINQSMTICVKNPSNQVIYINQIQSGFNGQYAVVFRLPEDAEDGIYTVLVGSEKVSGPKMVAYYYEKPNDFEVSFDSDDGREFFVNVIATDISDDGEVSYVIQYDPTQVSVVDLCAQTPVEETTAGSYDGVTITELSPGTIRLTVSGADVEEGQVWSGTVVIIKFRFKQNVDGITYLYLEKQ